jgi:hypothetical protein
MTRLESHRNAFRAAKVPMTGPLLRYSDLAPDERSLLESELAHWARMVAPARLTPTFSAWVFHSNGIMCPHPIGSREYDGTCRSDVEIPFDESNWFRCGICGSLVINR